jgi:catechol 2,3-dioxygenase-like lactoylglutathione lyase family enzyme
MGQWRRTGMIQYISAVTFAVNDMARSIEFYRKLGFELLYGDDRAEFSSMKAGEAFVNLAADPRYEHRWWGRAIFRVDDVDAHYRALQAQGLMLEAPRALFRISDAQADAPWGERFFHITDPDGHELSFAEMLPVRA